LKALVTGASGFIGSHVVDNLLEKGFEVRCLIRKSSQIKWIDLNKIEVLTVDFENHQSLVDAMKDIDYVFHVAGLNFAKKKEDYYNVNTLGTKRLINAAYESKANIKRFVYVSSQTASGPSESLEKPINEESPRNPVTAYGKSKKNAEDEVLAYKGKLPFTILKPPAVLGPRDTAIFNFFKMMYYGFAANMGLSKKYISIIYVEDLARGIIDSALSEKAVDNTYFLTNSDFYDWNYITTVFKVQMNRKFYFKIRVPDPIVLLVGRINEFISKIRGQQAQFDYDKSIDFTRKYWTCSAEKAKKDFGFSQQVKFEDAVKTTFEWYKFHKWL
jgi:nucleoside-diphosphate-sugar epimerase